jgi:hypothetical protein
MLPADKGIAFDRTPAFDAYSFMPKWLQPRSASQ